MCADTSSVAHALKRLEGKMLHLVLAIDLLLFSAPIP